MHCIAQYDTVPSFHSRWNLSTSKDPHMVCPISQQSPPPPPPQTAFRTVPILDWLTSQRFKIPTYAAPNLSAVSPLNCLQSSTNVSLVEHRWPKTSQGENLATAFLLSYFLQFVIAVMPWGRYHGADDQVMTVFTVQPSFHHRCLTNRVP